MQGEAFGRYRLLRRIAFGGMAEIFLAALHRDEGFEKRVVLKRILPQFSADPSFVQMFIDEAVVAARISHPNVVQVYDFGNVDGIYFIAMEHVDGVDLRGVLAAARRLSSAQVAAIGEGVARALAHAHNLTDDEGVPLNIVHRDVSPHNIMISRAGEAKLMDFGIAKAEARVSKTATGTIKGKVAYMAPEQGAGRVVDKRSDQFALGLVLWECITGERMFAGDSDLAVLQQVVRCEVRDLSEAAPEVPNALADVIMGCLAAEPDARYADLVEVAEALAAFRYSLGTQGAVQLGDLVPAAPLPESSSGRRTRALPEEPAGEVGSGSNEAGGWEEGGATAATAPAPGSPGSVASAPANAPPAPGVSLTPGGAPAASPGRGPSEPGAETTASAGGASIWRWVALGAAVIAVGVGAIVWHQLGAGAVDGVSARVEVTSAPAGARVLLEGRDTGLYTPATLPGQVRGRPLQLDVLLDGYEPWATQVTPSTPVERVAATLLRAEPAPGSAEAASPGAVLDSPDAGGSAPVVGVNGASEVASGSGAPVTPATEVAETDDSRSPDSVRSDRPGGKRKRRKTRPARAETTGRLSLRSTGAWVHVFLRGRKLGTTPLTSIEVPAGNLRLRLVNREAGIDQELEVTVRPDAELRRTVTPRP